MFEISIVNNCPITNSVHATVYLHPTVVSQLAGLMASEKGVEWAAVGRGWTSSEGMLIYITSLWIPEQTRSVSNVEIAEIEFTPEDICVFHSHHSMGAFFSGTDDTKLNPRFPVSIVLADLSTFKDTAKDLDRDYAGMYGFAHKGTAQVTLPCGQLGRVPAKLASPTDLLSVAWEKPEQPVHYWSRMKRVFQLVLHPHSLGDCNGQQKAPRQWQDGSVDPFYETVTLGCNSVLYHQFEKNLPVVAAFGSDHHGLADQLPKPAHQGLYFTGTVVRKPGVHKPERYDNYQTLDQNERKVRAEEYDWYPEWQQVDTAPVEEIVYQDDSEADALVTKFLEDLNDAIRRKDESYLWFMINDHDFNEAILSFKTPRQLVVVK